MVPRTAAPASVRAAASACPCQASNGPHSSHLISSRTSFQVEKTSTRLPASARVSQSRRRTTASSCSRWQGGRRRRVGQGRVERPVRANTTQYQPTGGTRAGHREASRKGVRLPASARLLSRLPRWRAPTPLDRSPKASPTFHATFAPTRSPVRHVHKFGTASASTLESDAPRHLLASRCVRRGMCSLLSLGQRAATPRCYSSPARRCRRHRAPPPPGAEGCRTPVAAATRRPHGLDRALRRPAALPLHASGGAAAADRWGVQQRGGGAAAAASVPPTVPRCPPCPCPPTDQHSAQSVRHGPPLLHPKGDGAAQLCAGAGAGAQPPAADA